MSKRREHFLERALPRRNPGRSDLRLSRLDLPGFRRGRARSRKCSLRLLIHTLSSSLLSDSPTYGTAGFHLLARSVGKDRSEPLHRCVCCFLDLSVELSGTRSWQSYPAGSPALPDQYLLLLGRAELCSWSGAFLLLLRLHISPDL